MARAKQPDFCMFCSTAPCSCSRTTKTVAKPRPTKPIVHVAPPVATDAQMPVQIAPVRPAMDTDSASFCYALTNLANAGMLQPDDVMKYNREITTTLSTEEKSNIWRSTLGSSCG